MSNDGPTGGFREFVFRASVNSAGGMRKEANIGIETTAGQVVMQYEIASDEAELLGGNDTAPPPLAYFTSAISFCLMTQISRYAHMRKLNVHDVRMTTVVHYHNEGSVLRGDVRGLVDSIESTVEIDSDESDDTIQKLLEDAESGCYVHYALTNPMQVTNHLVHNGR